MSGVRRALLAVVGGLGLAVCVASPALADAPGPTDYLSEVAKIEPSTPAIEVGIVGGDSFFELRVERGTEVEVVGYQGEDYLWFRPDGEVFENQNSPATYLNANRYGTESPPASATADADPDWKLVASDGFWAWHDHRAHWMQSARPFGSQVGDQILEAVIPLNVDGTKVDVTIISTWQPAPSPLPMWFGALCGIGIAVGVWLLRPGTLQALVLTVPVTLLALVVGSWQYFSLPPETGPKPIWIVLPIIATMSSSAGVLLAFGGKRFAANAALLFIGVELAIWGFTKRDGLSAAIIPTNAPGWLDRFTTALAFVSGVGIAAIALWWLFDVGRSVSDSREPTDSPLPAQL